MDGSAREITSYYDKLLKQIEAIHECVEKLSFGVSGSLFSGNQQGVYSDTYEELMKDFSVIDSHYRMGLSVLQYVHESLVLIGYISRDSVTSDLLKTLETYFHVASLTVARTKGFSLKGDEHEDEKADLAVEADTLIERLKLEQDRLTSENISEKSDKKSNGFTMPSGEQRLRDLNGNLSSFSNRLKKAEIKHDKNLKNTNILESEINKLRSLIKSELDRASDIFESAQTDIDSKKTKAESTLKALTDLVVAGNYDKSAKAEFDLANSLRNYSVFLMVAVSLVVAFILFQFSAGSIDLAGALVRLAFTVVMGIPAGYLAKESAMHRRMYFQHIQTAIDLKTLDGFIVDLKEEQQRDIKAEVAKELFVSRHKKDNGESVGDTVPVSALDVGKAVLDKINFSSKSD